MRRYHRLRRRGFLGGALAVPFFRLLLALDSLLFLGDLVLRLGDVASAGSPGGKVEPIICLYFWKYEIDVLSRAMVSRFGIFSASR